MFKVNQNVKDDLHDLIKYMCDYKSLVDHTVIWDMDDKSDENMEPNKEYIALNMIAGPIQNGTDEKVLPKVGSGSELTSIRGDRTFTLSVRIYYNDYQEIANRMELVTQVSDINDYLHKQKRVRFTVASVVVGTTYSILINGITNSYVALIGDTISDVINGLVSALSDNSYIQNIRFENDSDTVLAFGNDDYPYSSSANVSGALVQRFTDFSIMRILNLSNITGPVQSNILSGGAVDILMASITRLDDTVDDYIESATFEFNDTDITVSIP